jgi:hypothetical protein
VPAVSAPSFQTPQSEEPLLNWKQLLAATALIWLATVAVADDPVQLREAPPVGRQFHVSSRSEINGSLSLPPEKDKKDPKSLTITGTSAIEYDERILGVNNDKDVDKTLRIYGKIDFERKVGEQEQQSTVRSSVRRLVIMRQGNLKAPFSPDGPLIWQELDLVRTDVFAPALTGLLPDKPVKPGERWIALTPAILELTDMLQIDEGRIECRLDEVASDKGHRRARVAFSGTVRGINEDGPNRQQLDGYYYFDLDQNCLSYITLDGTSSMLDADGKVAGAIKGRFTLTRQALRDCRDLSDSSLKGVPLDPTDDLTRMLYEDSDLGIRFLYPRRWHIAQAQGNQIDLDSADGNGARLIVESLRTLPTTAQFLNDTQHWLSDQKAKILKTEQPKLSQVSNAEYEQFALDTDMNGKEIRLVYYVDRQRKGGATLSARLLPGKQLGDVEKEVEGIVRSLEIFKELKEVKGK